MKNITCFIPRKNADQVKATTEHLRGQELVKDVLYITGDIRSTANIRSIAERSTTPYTLIYTKYSSLQFVLYALERMEALISDTGADMIYADHFNKVGETITQAPVIDYQFGSLRDDFDFGSVLLYRTSALKRAVKRMRVDYKYAGLYDLRLKVSQKGSIEHINEYLYYDVELDDRKSGEKIFDYVDPKNRAVQVEMEQCVTQHLKDIGGYLKPTFKAVNVKKGVFEYEASVIIPCKNRVRTIAMAIHSALSQKVNAKFNVFVVDDNSTDGTVEAIKKVQAEGHDNLIYIAQDKTWHAIGGNWNVALHHPQCGRFAIQLDSDDSYSDEHTVQRIIDTFYKENVPMVVGSYMLTDFNGRELPPGKIDHKEWTPENGRNNALRINGLGCPRAFYTPLIREINLPTTKYGEDYAVGLRITREYQIARIYDVLYLIRRWDDNSDADCSLVEMNNNNLYKDRLRTWELKARIAFNQTHKKK